MMAAFYTFREDSEGVISSYEMFNKTFHDLNTVYREVTSQDLVIGDSVQVSCRELERRMQGEVRRMEKTLAAGTGYVPDVVASNVALDKEVADFLRRLNLGKLKETFAIQEHQAGCCGCAAICARNKINRPLESNFCCNY